jgi:hypothetical protein
MERDFTLREKQLSRAVRQRLLGDYRFDVCEHDLLFILGDRRFLLSRDHVVEASDLGHVADMVAQALTPTYGWYRDRHSPAIR